MNKKAELVKLRMYGVDLQLNDSALYRIIVTNLVHDMSIKLSSYCNRLDNLHVKFQGSGSSVLILILDDNVTLNSDSFVILNFLASNRVSREDCRLHFDITDVSNKRLVSFVDWGSEIFVDYLFIDRKNRIKRFYILYDAMMKWDKIWDMMFDISVTEQDRQLVRSVIDFPVISEKHSNEICIKLLSYGDILFKYKNGSLLDFDMLSWLIIVTDDVAFKDLNTFLRYCAMFYRVFDTELKEECKNLIMSIIDRGDEG